jgi:hypothetical protein
MSKKTWDWIGIIGIIVMIVAAVFVYFESKKCNNPLPIIIRNTLEDQGIENATYGYAIVSIYDENEYLAKASWKISYDGSYLPLYKVIYHQPERHMNLTFRNPFENFQNSS